MKNKMKWIKVGNLLFSEEIKTDVNWQQAMEWAKSNNARLPNNEELEQISSINYGGNGLYTKIVGNNQFIWSSSIIHSGLAFVLGGNGGYVGGGVRNSGLGAARFVRSCK